MLQLTATHCNTLQHTAIYFKTLQLSATLCNTLQHAATHYSTLLLTTTYFKTVHHSVMLCNTRQHTATHCNTLQTLHHTATHCNTLQHTATHCNTLQHTATHCNSLHHPHRLITNVDQNELIEMIDSVLFLIVSSWARSWPCGTQPVKKLPWRVLNRDCSIESALNQSEHAI